MAKKNIAGNDEIIQCLLLPIEEDYLILPNAAVAEILFFTDIEAVDNTPSWFLGLLKWRDLSLPVLSIEAAIKDCAAPAQHQKQKYAVLKALGDDSSFQFFAIRTEGIPRLVRVDKATINPGADDTDPPPFVITHVTIHNNSAIIPDLDKMELEIKTVLKEIA